MNSRTNDILQGTLTLFILRTFASNKRMHGYAMTVHIKRISTDRLRVEEGSLYPALQRLGRAGWGITGRKRQARFYSLTPNGRKRLARK